MSIWEPEAGAGLAMASRCLGALCFTATDLGTNGLLTLAAAEAVAGGFPPREPREEEVA